jgi:S-adenosylmethionine-diacylgycerolhomoserine-N-methlytransferase
MTDAAATADMNRIYRRQRHIYNFTRRYFLLGRDRLIDGLKPGAGDKVLEIGCGTGRNLIVAAEKYPQARFFGIDVSTEMLTSAHEAIDRAGLAGRIRIAHADATSFDPRRLLGSEKFERIFFSYTLSMIPHWEPALDSAISHLAAGGELHIVDFGGQSGLPSWFRTALRNWVANFHVTPRDTLELALRARASSLAFERPYRDYAQYGRFAAS